MPLSCCFACCKSESLCSRCSGYKISSRGFFGIAMPKRCEKCRGAQAHESTNVYCWYRGIKMSFFFFQ